MKKYTHIRMIVRNSIVVLFFLNGCISLADYSTKCNEFDKKQIRETINNFYYGINSASYKKSFEYIATKHNKRLSEEKLLDIWKHMIHKVKLIETKNIVVKGNKAKATVTLEMEHLFSDSKEKREIKLYLVKENAAWKLNYGREDPIIIEYTFSKDKNLFYYFGIFVKRFFIHDIFYW